MDTNPATIDLTQRAIPVGSNTVPDQPSPLDSLLARLRAKGPGDKRRADGCIGGGRKHNGVKWRKALGRFQ